jgi:hypothetical protein
MRSGWNDFCFWAIGAEPWGAAIAMTALTLAMIWTFASSAILRITDERLGVRLTPPIYSILWVSCWIALSAYTALFFAARHTPIAAAISLTLCATVVRRLARMVQNARGVILM